jgi:hypothetical protein
LRDQVEAIRTRSKNEIKAQYNSKIQRMRNHMFTLQQHHVCLASVAAHATADRQLKSNVQILVACTELVVRPVRCMGVSVTRRVGACTLQFY